MPVIEKKKDPRSASAAPKAQQQPQLDWSRMSLMTVAHFGQFVAESKESGTYK